MQAFAADLRALRARAGNPTYEAMARHTGRSKTALANAAAGAHVPRWRTVEAYVAECGGDVDAWRLRWEALSAESPAAGIRPAPDRAAGPDPHRRPGWRLPAATGALVAAGTVAAIVFTPGTTPAPPTPLTTSPGVVCETVGDVTVVIRELTAVDGRPGIATQNRITLEVLRGPRRGHTYWIMLHLLRDDGDPYIAKARLGTVPGPDVQLLQFNDSVGSRRDIYVVEADPVESTALEQNLASQFDGSRDTSRGRPPAADVVSAVCHVQKTRPT